MGKQKTTKNKLYICPNAFWCTERASCLHGVAHERNPEDDFHSCIHFCIHSMCEDFCVRGQTKGCIPLKGNKNVERKGKKGNRK